jgi:MFS family permease
MQLWQRNLYVLWFGVFIAAISFSFISPFLPLFLEQMGVVEDLEAWSGALFSAAFASSCILAPVWGSLADKYGRKIMIIRAGVGMGLVNLLMAAAQTPTQLLFLRLLNGVVSGFIPSSVALVATNTPEQQIGVSLGLLRTGSAAGSVLGPLAGGVLAHYVGIRQTFVVAAVTLWLATAVVIFGIKELAQPLGSSAKLSVVQDLRLGWHNREFRTLMVFVALTNASVAVLQPVLTPFIMSITTKDASLYTGIVFSLTGVATVLAAPFWGRRGARGGFKGTLVFSMLCAGLINLPQVLTRQVAVFGGLRFMYGLAFAGTQVSIEAMTANVVSSEFRGRAFGIAQSFSQLGFMLGPLMGGLLGSALGINWVFGFTGLMLVSLSFAGRSLLGRAGEDAGTRSKAAG